MKSNAQVGQRRRRIEATWLKKDLECEYVLSEPIDFSTELVN